MGAPSAFRHQGLGATIRALCSEIRRLYLEDETPWVVGYSGGKDSSAALQLVWLAIRELLAAERTKTVHVISTTRWSSSRWSRPGWMRRWRG